VISIPLIRRRLANDLLGRHIYFFGQAASSTLILRQLADAGADEGTIVLSEEEGTCVSVAVLIRQSLPVGAVPLFSAISTLALTEAVETEGLSASPMWPDQVVVKSETAGRGLVDTASTGRRTPYVVLGGDIDLGVLAKAAGHAIESNGLVAAFLNAVDKWSTAYAAHGPAAIKAAVRFLPGAPVAVSSMEERHAGQGSAASRSMHS
jgi:hypothetical protein